MKPAARKKAQVVMLVSGLLCDLTTLSIIPALMIVRRAKNDYRQADPMLVYWMDSWTQGTNLLQGT